MNKQIYSLAQRMMNAEVSRCSAVGLDVIVIKNVIVVSVCFIEQL